jgi:RND family efflux transporter MFP subunit
MPIRHATHLSLLIILSSCRPPLQAAESQESFPIAVPSIAAAHHDREYVGEVQAIQRVELRARVKGRIESVVVDEGQAVKANQLLFALGTKELQQELRRARAAVASAAADLNAAEIERANLKMLLAKAVVSPAEMAIGDAKVASLAAKLEEAKANEGQATINVSYAEIRAPFAGVINRVPKKTGSMVEEGEHLTTLTNTSEVYVYFRVSEQEYLEYASAKGDGRNKEVSFKLANGELLTSVGMTDAVESEVDRNTGTIAFRARFANDGQLLKHGSSGKVVVRSLLKDAVVVPQKATFEIQDHVYVYVVDSEGKARARRIHPKARLKDAFIVDTGLKAGERFITEGIQRIKDGERVAIRTDTPTTATTL